MGLAAPPDGWAGAGAEQKKPESGLDKPPLIPARLDSFGAMSSNMSLLMQESFLKFG